MPSPSTHDLEFISALTERNGQAVAIIGADGAVSFATDSARELVRRTGEELAFGTGRGPRWGNPIDEYGQPFTPANWPISRALRNGERSDAVLIGFREPREITWVSLSCFPLTDNSWPTRRAAVVFLEDVTGRRSRHLDAAEQQAILASAFDAAPVAMVVSEHDGEVVRANAAFDRLSPAGPFGRRGPWWSFIDEPDRTALFEQLEGLARHERAALGLECRGHDAEGKPVVVQISGARVPPRHEPGGIDRLSVQISDITALRQSELRLRTLTEAVPVGIYELGRDGSFTYATPLMETIAGAQLIGRNAIEFIHPEDRDRARMLFERALQGHDWSAEHRVVNGRGDELIVLTGGHPVRDLGGEVTSVICTLLDLTEHARVQARLRALDHDYESLAAQQARERLEAQLAQSQRFETLGRLAGGVAHDFNNLLGVISNYAGFLAKRRDLPEALHHDVHQISEAARRGAELTRQLLLFSRREQLRPQRFDLSRVLGELGALMTRPLRPRIELRIDAQGECFIEADQGQIEQMVLNLLINARDALPAGGWIAMTARVEQHGGNGVVVLDVIDNGIGMSPDVQARIFEPFFTTKPRSEASGLGMATVQGIVEQAGGTVLVTSAVDQGTTVTVRLPAAGGPGADEAGAA